MKFNNETKIGLFAVLSIAMLIWGFNFLKGRNIINKQNTYYAEYDDVDYLAKSSPVLLNGFPAGVVTDIFPVEGNMDKLVVEFTLDKVDFKLPKNTVGVIISQSIMGGKAIELITSIPCSDEFPCDDRESYLRGYTESLIESMIGSPQDVDKYMENVSKNFGPMLDTLKTEFKGDPDAEGLNRTMYDLAQTAKNLNAATNSLNKLLQASSGSFSRMTHNLADITGTINNSEQDISQILSNAAEFSDDLSELDLDSTVVNMNATLSELQNSLTQTRDIMESMNRVLAKVEKGEGSLGKLIVDDEAYRQIITVMNHVDTLAQDFQQRPYRYIPLKNRNRVLKYDEKDAR